MTIRAMNANPMTMYPIRYNRALLWDIRLVPHEFQTPLLKSSIFAASTRHAPTIISDISVRPTAGGTREIAANTTRTTGIKHKRSVLIDQTLVLPSLFLFENHSDIGSWKLSKVKIRTRGRDA